MRWGLGFSCGGLRINNRVKILGFQVTLIGVYRLTFSRRNASQREKREEWGRGRTRLEMERA